MTKFFLAFQMHYKIIQVIRFKIEKEVLTYGKVPHFRKLLHDSVYSHQ